MANPLTKKYRIKSATADDLAARFQENQLRLDENQAYDLSALEENEWRFITHLYNQINFTDILAFTDYGSTILSCPTNEEEWEHLPILEKEERHKSDTETFKLVDRLNYISIGTAGRQSLLNKAQKILTKNLQTEQSTTNQEDADLGHIFDSLFDTLLKETNTENEKTALQGWFGQAKKKGLSNQELLLEKKHLLHNLISKIDTGFSLLESNNLAIQDNISDISNYLKIIHQMKAQSQHALNNIPYYLIALQLKLVDHEDIVADDKDIDFAIGTKTDYFIELNETHEQLVNIVEYQEQQLLETQQDSIFAIEKELPLMKASLRIARVLAALHIDQIDEAMNNGGIETQTDLTNDLAELTKMLSSINDGNIESTPEDIDDLQARFEAIDSNLEEKNAKAQRQSAALNKAFNNFRTAWENYVSADESDEIDSTPQQENVVEPETKAEASSTSHKDKRRRKKGNEPASP